MHFDYENKAQILEAFRKKACRVLKIKEVLNGIAIFITFKRV